MSERPIVRLIGENGNIFNLMGICRKALVRAGLHDEAKQMATAVMQCKSYDEALMVLGEYVEIE